MTNLEWIKTQATKKQIAKMLDRISCETCAYESTCNMTTLHRGDINCDDGIMMWLLQERKDV